MKKLMLILPLLLAGTTVVNAQDANAILTDFASSGPKLSGAVYDELMVSSSMALEFCQSAVNAGYYTQLAVGAGFAQAYDAYRAVDDLASAAQIAQVACTCGATAGQILASFAAQLGGVQADVCSVSWDGEARTPPSLLRTSAGGGGGGGGDPVSPN